MSWVLKVAPSAAEDVPCDFMKIEQAGEEIIAIFSPKAATCNGEKQLRRRPVVSHDRHQIASPRMAIENIMGFSIDTAINRMDQAVALSPPGCTKKVPVKIRSPPGVNATETGLSMPPVSTGSIPAIERARKICAARVTKGGRWQVVSLLGESAFAPVNPAVRPKVRPVQDRWRNQSAFCPGAILRADPRRHRHRCRSVSKCSGGAT